MSQWARRRHQIHNPQFRQAAKLVRIQVHEPLCKYAPHLTCRSCWIQTCWLSEENWIWWMIWTLARKKKEENCNIGSQRVLILGVDNLVPWEGLWIFLGEGIFLLNSSTWIPCKLVIPSRFISWKNSFLTALIMFWQNPLPVNFRKWVFSWNKTLRNYKFAWNSWYAHWCP